VNLGLDDDELSGCVGCGLCLPHCPTFRVTGDESRSPRGRIATMRAVHWEGLAVGDDVVAAVETCVQCRGCETACPSGVHFGHLMEQTREALAERCTITPWWQRRGLGLLGSHRVVLWGSTLLAMTQRLHLVPKRLGIPELSLRRGAPLRSTGSDVWLFTGCVMDAWQRPTHRATAEVLAALGVGVQVPGPGAACCGALHTHAGLGEQARRLAERTMAAMPGDAPIVVNSAGCGAALSEYGQLLGTQAARAFSARVVDVQAFVAPRAAGLAVTRRLGPVVVQDPCHLRHVQRAHQHTRTVLAAVADVVELDDEGLCCGAGGAYSALQPELATDIRRRKLDAIERARARTGATVVASANPGCAMHLSAAGVRVAHPMELVAEALR
jgi:glycolate oxidase iron-sulfur subunit